MAFKDLNWYDTLGHFHIVRTLLAGLCSFLRNWSNMRIYGWNRHFIRIKVTSTNKLTDLTCLCVNSLETIFCSVRSLDKRGFFRLICNVTYLFPFPIVTFCLSVNSYNSDGIYTGSHLHCRCNWYHALLSVYVRYLNLSSQSINELNIDFCCLYVTNFVVMYVRPSSMRNPVFVYRSILNTGMVIVENSKEKQRSTLLLNWLTKYAYGRQQQATSAD